MPPPGSPSSGIWRGVCSGRLRSAGSPCGSRLGAQRAETESAERKDVQVERRLGLGGPSWGRRCREERLGAGLERVLAIRIGNLGSILEQPNPSRSTGPALIWLLPRLRGSPTARDREARTSPSSERPDSSGAQTADLETTEPWGWRLSICPSPSPDPH